MRRAALLLLAGCAAQHPALKWPDGAAESATGWWRFTTPDFSLVTDLRMSQGRDAAEAIQHELLALRAMLGNLPPRFRRPLRIVVLSNGIEYERYFGRVTSGLTQRSSDGVTVFLWGSSTRWTSHETVAEGVASVLTHELAHVVLDDCLGEQPRWFAEGMAQFLEPYLWSDDGRSVELGLANQSSYTIYLTNRSQGAEEAIAWGPATALEGERGRTLYGYTWALVHYLINVQPQRFAEIIRLIALHEPDGAAKIGAYVVNSDARSLDAAVHEYMRIGTYATFKVAVPHDPRPASTSGLDAAELEATRHLLETASATFGYDQVTPW